MKRSEAQEIALKIAGVERTQVTQKINSYFDKSDLAKQIWEIQPYFYDKSKIWWLWNNEEKKWEMIDDTDILNAVSELSTANTVDSKDKNEIIESMKQFGRKKLPKPVKKTWVQFKGMVYDILTGKAFKATPEYFTTNPISWALNKESCGTTPVIDRIFTEWVGEKFKETLYEIISYSLIPDYPIHRLFCLIGAGLNGKGCYLRLLEKFLGQDNLCSTELDTLLTSRFEVSRLHKKLLCVMGETNFSEMKKTSMLKKLSGGDLIGFEYKGKKHFEDYNYAKILIATNNLPTTTDKTIGFYRRWLIIDFPNQFDEAKDILSEIPDEEYEALACKSVIVLSSLLSTRQFTNEGNIEERMKKYEDRSDPLEKFLKEFTQEDANKFIYKWDFEKRLNGWCKEHRFREIAENTIGKKMKDKGFESTQVSAEWYDNDKLIKRRVRAWSGLTWCAQVAQVEQVTST